MKDFFNVVDIVFFAVVLLAALNGLRRKLSGELAGVLGSLLALVAGFYVSQLFCERVSAHTRLSDNTARTILFFVSTVAVLLLSFSLRILLRNTIKVVVNGSTTELVGGFVAGLLKATILASMLIIGMNMWPHPYLNRVFGKESAVGRALVKSMPGLREKAEEAGEKADDVRDSIRSGEPVR